MSQVLEPQTRPRNPRNFQDQWIIAEYLSTEEPIQTPAQMSDIIQPILSYLRPVSLFESDENQGEKERQRELERDVMFLADEQRRLAILASEETNIVILTSLVSAGLLVVFPIIGALLIPVALYGFFKRRESLRKSRLAELKLAVSLARFSRRFQTTT